MVILSALCCAILALICKIYNAATEASIFIAAMFIILGISQHVHIEIKDDRKDRYSKHTSDARTGEG